LKAGKRPEEIAQARAHWAAAKAAGEYARARLDRVRRLGDSTIVSAEEFDAVQSASLAAEQNLLSAKAALELAETGPRAEQIAQASAKIERQQQEIARLGVQLRYHSIHAPFRGFVVRKHTEVGEWLTRGDPVVELVQLDPIDVMVYVPESLVAQLRPGDVVPLTFDALSNDSDSLQGTIRGIGPSADQRSRAFPVRIRLPNPKIDGAYLLRDGMQARAILSGKPRSTLTAPKDALILGGAAPAVIVAEKREKGQVTAVRIEVGLGVAREDWIEVRGELRPGQQVVVRGNERVQPGQILRVLPNKANGEKPDD
ncbi:MAG: efflux RND transporter periplasmic adaptor subunit, partial [Planctomycetales bacterium]